MSALPPTSVLAPTARRARLRPLVARAAAVLGLAVLAGQLQAGVGEAAVTDRWMADAPAGSAGWTADFRDDFDRLDLDRWGRYEGGVPAGTVSTYRAGNVWVDNGAQVGDGVLTLTSKQVDGRWSGAGVSGARGFSAVRGKWVVKAKFDRAHGIGYAFLLMPKGGGWPPELDIVEGTMGGPHMMSTYHYGKSDDHRQIQRWNYGVDTSQWHTYGVVMDEGSISYTVDGRVWATVQTSAVTSKPMWIGFQTGVKDCAKSTGECLDASTPASSDISVDWVAHYRRS